MANSFGFRVLIQLVANIEPVKFIFYLVIVHLNTEFLPVKTSVQLAMHANPHRGKNAFKVI